MTGSFTSDIILFGLVVVLFSYIVPVCTDEPSMRPFNLLRTGLNYVLRLALIATILACAVVLFTLATVVICAFTCVLYVGSFVFGILYAIVTKRKRK